MENFFLSKTVQN